jgi:predicted acetyltransferase
VRDGIMARVVTVEDGLAQRRFAAATELRFRLVDEVCPWNSGSWRVATGPEGGAVSRIDGQGVDFVLGPDTLASLVFGRFGAVQAARAGLLDEVAGGDTLARWEAALRLDHAPHEAEHTW